MEAIDRSQWSRNAAHRIRIRDHTLANALFYQAFSRLPCWRTQACIAMPAATAALMLRVEPNCAIETVSAAPSRASSLMPGPSWPNSSRQSRGSVVCSSRTAPGTLSTATTVRPAVGGEAQQLGGGVVVPQMLVAVGDHGAAAVPAAAPDDVHGVHGERVGGAHHRADVGVVAEVLDRDVRAGGGAVSMSATIASRVQYR